MPSRRSSKVLARIVDIRMVQRSATETRLATAERALRTRQGERDEAVTRLEETEARWAKTLSGGSIPMHMTAALGAAVLEDEQGLVLAQAEVARAKTERLEVEGHWKAALANEQAALSLAKSAIRKEARQRDEAALQDIADRAARQDPS